MAHEAAKLVISYSDMNVFEGSFHVLFTELLNLDVPSLNQISDYVLDLD